MRFSKLVARGENPEGVTVETPNGTEHWPLKGPFASDNTSDRPDDVYSFGLQAGREVGERRRRQRGDVR